MPLREKLYRTILALLLVPLFFIMTGEQYDWGDDFAQYIIQAKNITEGKPQAENGLIRFAGFPSYAVEAYPAGFPLILATVYGFWGLQIQPYLIMESFFLALSALFVYGWFRKLTGSLAALLISLLFVYNPYTLEMKGQVLSDIPFTALVFLTLLMFRDMKQGGIHPLITGILCALVTSVKINGMVLVPALILSDFLTCRSSELPGSGWIKRFILRTGSLVGAFLAVFLLINFILFPVPVVGLLSFYREAVTENPVKVFSTIRYYIEVTGELFFIPGASNLIKGLLVLALVCTGLIKIRERYIIPGVVWMVFSVIILLWYPYNAGGFRLLFPLFPFLLYFMYKGLEGIQEQISGSRAHRFVPVIFSAIILLYVVPWLALCGNPRNNDGPMEASAAEAFRYLAENVPSEEAVVFPRARAMVLFGHHPGAYLVRSLDSRENLKMFRESGVRFLMEPLARGKDSPYDPLLEKYLKENRKAYTLLWQNGRYALYELNE